MVNMKSVMITAVIAFIVVYFVLMNIEMLGYKELPKKNGNNEK